MYNWPQHWDQRRLQSVWNMTARKLFHLLVRGKMFRWRTHLLSLQMSPNRVYFLFIFHGCLVSIYTSRCFLKLGLIHWNLKNRKTTTGLSFCSDVAELSAARDEWDVVFFFFFFWCWCVVAVSSEWGFVDSDTKVCTNTENFFLMRMTYFCSPGLYLLQKSHKIYIFCGKTTEALKDTKHRDPFLRLI